MKEIEIGRKNLGDNNIRKTQRREMIKEEVTDSIRSSKVKDR